MGIDAESKERLDRPRLVVGIGASAGGLDACRKFLATMRAESGMAIIVVMHLDPNRESHIGEIFRNSTALAVVEVSEPHPLRPDRIYVIVPDTSLEVRDGVLHPHKPQDPRGQRHPVDTLFSSLAEDQKERAVGIVMSGTGSDGSSGVRDIKGLGGLCPG